MHWHVEVGDGSEIFQSVTEVSDHMVTYVLSDMAQYLVDLRDIETADGDKSLVEGKKDLVGVAKCLLHYRHAAHLQRDLESIDTLCMNLDNKRANAPLYQYSPEKWKVTLTDLLLNEFPLVHRDYSTVRVYPCPAVGCLENMDPKDF